MESILRDSGLKSSIKKFVESKTQHIIEFELFSGQETIAMHSSKKGSTFEKSSGVFFFQSKEFSGSFSELGEGKMDSPYFTLILESVLSNELQFVINPLLFVCSSGSLVGGGV